MKEVAVLKEINLLDSGEMGFHVEVYETLEKAEAALQEQVNAYLEEGKRITWRDGNNIQLKDEDNNEYEFDIEVLTVRK
jgi:hypothetical protein